MSGPSSPSPSASSSQKSRSSSPDDEPFTAAPELLSAFDELMASRLAVDLLPPPPPSPAPTAPQATVESDDDVDADGTKKAMTKAEKQNAKKKRRKERERLAREAAAAALAALEPQEAEPDEAPIRAFRLFSAVRPVSLSTVERYEVTPNPRLRALPFEIQERIRRLAGEAAVEASDLHALPARSWPVGYEVGVETKDLPPAFVSFVAAKSKCRAVPAVRVFQTLEERRDGVPFGAKRRRRRREFPAPRRWWPENGTAPGYEYGWSLR